MQSADLHKKEGQCPVAPYPAALQPAAPRPATPQPAALRPAGHQPAALRPAPPCPAADKQAKMVLLKNSFSRRYSN